MPTTVDPLDLSKFYIKGIRFLGVLA